LKAIGVAIGDTARDGKSCSHVRYYILSRKLSARRFAAAVGGHWSIENCLHWQLDVTFQEDPCRVRQGHADANLSILRRAALGLLKNNHSQKVGVKNKRLRAAWNDNYRLEILCGPLLIDLSCNRPGLSADTSIVPASYPHQARNDGGRFGKSP